MKDSQLKAAIMKLVDSFRPINYKDSFAPKARNEHVSKRQKTKKGAIHIQGENFTPRHIFEGVTPAQFRRRRLGNPKKAFYENLKAKKWEAKWTSGS
jgi:hypothetical protein